MGISSRIKKTLQNWLKEESNQDLLIDGTLKDKKEVNDPTSKFVNIRYTNSIAKRYSEHQFKNTIFYPSEYDLKMIANAVMIDGILQRTVNVYVEQILKNGYELTSKKPPIQDHVNKRINEIQNLTGITYLETISQVSRQLVTYGNAYLIKVRSYEKSQFGNKYDWHGKTLDPIVGLFLADASTVKIGLNKNDEVTYFLQNINGKLQDWPASDVIHFTYNKIPGTITGRSNIISVLDDVRALRKLEEELEILGFQYAIPLYLYKVGTKEIPAAIGEINNVKSTIDNMPSYGMLVVPGHHTVEVPTNNNSPLDLISYVNHFKQRVLGGLGVSPIAIGESNSSNRNTSEILDLSMQAITVSYQQIIKARFEMELIQELLLDGGFNKIDDKLELNFPEIDLENQIKKETHIIAKFQNNLITRSEARNEMDYTVKLDNNDTFLNIVEIPLIEAKGSVASEVAKKKSISNKNQPANQHGKLNAKPKIAKDEINKVVKINNKLIDEMIDVTQESSNINIDVYSQKLLIVLNDHIKKQINENMKQYIEYFNLNINIESDSIICDYTDHIQIILKDKLKRYLPKINNQIKFNRFVSSINDFIFNQENKINNLSKILLYKALGYSTILISSEDCLIHSSKNLDVNNITIKDIPSYSTDCNCTVDEEGLYEFKIFA